MNWNAVGAIGQILGSLATFVTVGYLVVQVHDTERDIKRSIAQSRAERNMELNLALTDERLSAIHVKGNLGVMASAEHLMPGTPPVPAAFEAFVKQAGLTPEQAASLQSVANARVPPDLDVFIRRAGSTVEEAVSLSAELQARWNNMSQTILYIDELSPGDRAQFDRTTRGGFSELLVRLWYESAKGNYNPDVVRYVDNLLAQPNNGPSPTPVKTAQSG
jgi:hypothetical protein